MGTEERQVSSCPFWVNGIGCNPPPLQFADVCGEGAANVLVEMGETSLMLCVSRLIKDASGVNGEDLDLCCQNRSQTPAFVGNKLLELSSECLGGRVC